jgi:hypothetical protein
MTNFSVLYLLSFIIRSWDNVTYGYGVQHEICTNGFRGTTISLYPRFFSPVTAEHHIYKQLFMHIRESPALKIEWRV